MVDFWGFIKALTGDWIGLMSSGVSILLTIVGFVRPQNQKKHFWIAGAVCLFLGSVHVWSTEHAKVIGQIASLDASVAQVVFAGDPFPVGHPINLYIVWHNFGPSDAVHGQHSGRLYILPNDEIGSQRAMIAAWKLVADT